MLYANECHNVYNTSHMTHNALRISATSLDVKWSGRKHESKWMYGRQPKTQHPTPNLNSHSLPPRSIQTQTLPWLLCGARYVQPGAIGLVWSFSYWYIGTRVDPELLMVARRFHLKSESDLEYIPRIVSIIQAE